MCPIVDDGTSIVDRTSIVYFGGILFKSSSHGYLSIYMIALVLPKGIHEVAKDQTENNQVVHPDDHRSVDASCIDTVGSVRDSVGKGESFRSTQYTILPNKETSLWITAENDLQVVKVNKPVQ